MSDNTALVWILAIVCGSIAAVRIAAHLASRGRPAEPSAQQRDRAKDTDRG